MLNTDAKLSAQVFADDIDKQSTRDGFGKGVVEAGRDHPHIVVLSADLKESTRAEWFEKEFPGRFIELGVAEQNMATVAAGLAAVGKIPFITSYAAFSPGRNYEQIRTTIALNNVPVIVCGMHAGVSVGPDGATHQMLEDMALMRAMPNMIVVNPGDAEEGRKATLAAATAGKPVYLRFGRADVPVFTTSETPFSFGNAISLWNEQTPRAAILSTGSLSYNALLAARALSAHGLAVSVMHVPCIKPLPEEAILAVAKAACRVVTVEEHQVMGGFGSAVAEYLSAVHPVPVLRLGIHDSFGQSGDPHELIDHYGLSATGIQDAVKRFVA